MNIRMIALLLVAVVAAAGAVFAASSWIATQRAELARSEHKPQPKQAAIEILVARETLPTGTLLREDHFRWQPWPSETLSTNYLRRKDIKIDDLVGSVVRNPVTLGEPVTEAKIVHPGERGFLAAVLKPEHRAVTVGVNAISGIAGFIFPGDRVDLLLTHEIKQGKKSRNATETVLADIRVLAIDQSTDDQADKPKLSKNVTLELTPKQAEMVTLMSSIGRLSLSLRSLQKEEEPAFDPNLSPEALLASLNAEDEPKDERLRGHTWDSEVSHLLYVPEEQVETVTVVRGGKALVQAFPKDGSDDEGDSVIDFTPRHADGMIPNLALPSGTLPSAAAGLPEGAN